MILRLATLIGVPTWAIKVALVALLLIAAGVAKCTYDQSVIDDYEGDVQANVEVVTDKAEAKADGKLDRSTQDFTAEQAKDQKEVDNAKADNRSPLDALFN